MKIQVAGPGCPRCQAVEKNVREACEQLGISADVGHVTDPREIARLGVMITPAVVVDGTVVESGHVPGIDRLKELLARVA